MEKQESQQKRKNDRRKACRTTDKKKGQQKNKKDCRKARRSAEKKERPQIRKDRRKARRSAEKKERKGWIEGNTIKQKCEIVRTSKGKRKETKIAEKRNDLVFSKRNEGTKSKERNRSLTICLHSVEISSQFLSTFCQVK